MDGEHYISYTYKMRSSGHVPVRPGHFLAQTFGVDKNEVTTWVATTTITRSDDFIGANISGDYISANFQRLPYFNEAGENIFSGQTVGITQFVDESSIPGS